MTLHAVFGHWIGSLAQLVCETAFRDLSQQRMTAESMDVPNHLVIVCGHAIWLGGPRNGYDEAEWLIESYKAGETPTFIEHINAGIKILSEDERSVVMFSG